MAFAVVVDQPETVGSWDRERYRDALRKKSNFNTRDLELVAAKLGEPDPPQGHLWTHFDSYECPLGRPNCRNCGDPDYAEDCKAKGHCHQCGIDHGVTPQHVLEKRGFKIHEVDIPEGEVAWDHRSLKFVPRKDDPSARVGTIVGTAIKK